MSSKTTVKITKEFNVSAEKIFEAWIDPAMLRCWMFGPEVRDEKIVKLKTNPEKGGNFTFVVRRNNEVINHLGTYLELNYPHRLVFTWGIESESEDESIVTIDIESTESGCKLTLVHELDPKWEEYAERTREGWNTMLDILKEIFTNK